MRNAICLLVIVSLAACGGGGGGGVTEPQVGSAACENDGQKRYVLDNLYFWYLWNDLLPADIDIADYTTPEELVRQVTREFGPQDANGNPIDLFSSVGSAQADSEFFGEGKFEGFGFSYRTVDTAAGDVRLVRVYSDSPAANGGLARGQRFLSLNGRPIGDILANEGLNSFFSNNDPVTFEVQPVVGNSFSTPAISKDVVTIDPVPQWRIIDRGPGVPPVGYIELSQFISTADAELDAVFAAFRNASPPVNDVILDLRYNGGGLVSTANLLGNFFGALANDPSAALPDDGNVFSETQFNADRAAANNEVTRFQLQDNSMDLGRLVVIATGGTASASELVINSLEAWFDVAIVGANTFGKPVGQIGLTFCEKILRPTSFKTVNALREGDYFDGLAADCPAADDLNEPVGEDTDPNMIAAMSYLNTGACPVAAAPLDQFKAEAGLTEKRDRSGPPHREFADAY
jgi:C-terminal processing protease CtpA/Prc